MTGARLTSRRAFMAGAAILPVAMTSTALAAPLQNQERAQILTLITELENAPGYQAVSEHWIKAHIAGQLREALGIDVPPCENRRNFAVYDARAFETYKRTSQNWPLKFQQP